MDTLGAELIRALSLTHKHDLELLPIGVVVDVLSELLVNSVVLHWNVDGDARLQIDDVLAQRLNFALIVLHLLEHLELRGLRLVVFVFKLLDVGGGTLKLGLQLSLAGFHAIVMGLPHVALLFNIALLRQDRVQFEHCALKFYNCLLAFTQAKLKLINFPFVSRSLLLHQGFVLTLHLRHLISQLLL